MKKCTGKFDKIEGQFGTELHKECFGCPLKAVRTSSELSKWHLSPSALFKDGVCMAKQEVVDVA